jgi:ParB-like chromosome segregation protein Spo0J
MQEIKTHLDGIIEYINKLPLDEKVAALNCIREQLHNHSPFKNEPIDFVKWVPSGKVKANEYNPNKVASPEMQLLYQSIKLDGYTQPIVAYKLDDGTNEVVDGFHRNKIGKDHSDINKRLYDYLPLTEIDKPFDERMGSTIRHNRARGTHQIRSMSDIVLELSKQGWEDDKICKYLGMDLDEVIKLKQITGLKEAFANHEFSKSWEEYEKKRGEFYAEI